MMYFIFVRLENSWCTLIKVQDYDVYKSTKNFVDFNVVIFLLQLFPA